MSGILLQLIIVCVVCGALYVIVGLFPSIPGNVVYAARIVIGVVAVCAVLRILWPLLGVW